MGLRLRVLLLLALGAGAAAGAQIAIPPTAGAQVSGQGGGEQRSTTPATTGTPGTTGTQGTTGTGIHAASGSAGARSASASPVPPPRFVVVLDAAHGGSNQGARISAELLEKDVVLSLAVRLRSMLNARGIQVVTTREADVNPPALSRAEIANHAAAAACVNLHATATGSGVHLFTSSLSATPMTRFLPWPTAQSAYVAQSLRLSSEINSAMTHAQVPVSLGRTSLQPLDSFACPAVAVEISPLGATDTGGKPLELSSSEYQSRVVGALAAAIQQWREDWKKP